VYDEYLFKTKTLKQNSNVSSFIWKKTSILGHVITATHRKNLRGYETFHKASELNWFCGTKASSGNVAQDGDRWREPLNVVMNLRVPQNAGNVLTGWGHVSFCGRKVSCNWSTSVVLLRCIFFGKTSGFQHVSWQSLFKILSLDKICQYDNERQGF